ncbi:MAG: hypothetical protein R2788_20245 [Saprospiraceae bacterium]
MGNSTTVPSGRAAKMPKAGSPIIGGAKPDAKTTAAPPSRPTEVSAEGCDDLAVGVAWRHVKV